MEVAAAHEPLSQTKSPVHSESEEHESPSVPVVTQTPFRHTCPSQSLSDWQTPPATHTSPSQIRVPSQSTVLAHEEWQAPFRQTWPSLHSVSELQVPVPPFPLSPPPEVPVGVQKPNKQISVSVQTSLPQLAGSPKETQFPKMQTSPLGQLMPTAPQLADFPMGVQIPLTQACSSSQVRAR